MHQKWEDEGLELVAFIRNAAGRITKLGIDPRTGDILPRSVEVYGNEMTVSQEEITKKVEAILPKLEVGDQAWLGGHGYYWRIPLFLNGRLVSTVKVDAHSGTLVTRRSWHEEEDN